MALRQSSQQTVPVGVPVPMPFHVPVPVPVMGPHTHPPIQRPPNGKKLDVYVGTNTKRIPLKPLFFAGFFATMGTALGIWQRKNLLRGISGSTKHLGTAFAWISERATNLINKV